MRARAPRGLHRKLGYVGCWQHEMNSKSLTAEPTQSARQPQTAKQPDRKPDNRASPPHITGTDAAAQFQTQQPVILASLI